MKTITGLLASLLLGAACVALAPAPMSPSPAAAAQADKVEKGDKVTIIFRDGRTIPGTLVEETATTVKVLVTVAGISAETVYDKADILQIERSEETAADPVEDEPSKPTKRDDSPKNPGSADANASTVYYFELKGGLGREMAVTPLRDIVKDVKANEPDYLVIKVDMDFKVFNNEVKDYGHFFDQFSIISGMAPILTDDIARDRSWKKKPKLVFWVRSAMGGVAFLPFVSDTIYYTPDARQGGVGYLDRAFEGVGDEVVRDKQKSLRLARAIGLAARGGYEPQIIKAMTWSNYTLSYTMVGGKPVFYESNEGEHLLTDDGREGRGDAMEDIVRGRGNDILQLNAELANRLGISDGTAETFEELMNLMNIARSYKVVDSKAKRILEDWAEGVDRAERDFRRLLNDFVRIQVQGDYQERTAARGQQIRVLRQMKSILDRYGEAIDPREIGNLPDNWDSNIEIMINRIKNAQQLDGPP